MKANEILKESLTVEEIYKQIESCLGGNPNQFKYFIPHFIYVSPEVITTLIKNGFKVSNGSFYGMDFGLIIEW